MEEERRIEKEREREREKDGRFEREKGREKREGRARLAGRIAGSASRILTRMLRNINPKLIKLKRTIIFF